MADNDKSSKTEAPTQKRIEEAHNRGQFAKAQEIQIAAILAAIALVIMLNAPVIAQRVSEYMTTVLGSLHETDITPESIVAGIRGGIALLAPMILPLALSCSFAAIVAGGVQSEWRLTPKAIEFKWEKVSPLRGFKEKYSKAAFTRFGIELLKLLGIGTVIGIGVARVARDPLFSSPIGLERLGSFVLETALLLLGILIVVIGLIATINFLYQKRKTFDDLRMTRQEVKDERKQQEGDPLVRAAQRQMARQAARNQMFRRVPEADFVVTNPTHFAVALRYRRDLDPAPIVLAKGRNLVALRIRNIAETNGIPVVENRPLAQMLFRFGKIDNPIPVDLYQMTATVLAYVYRTYGRRATHRYSNA